jgi:putative endonuclease
MSAYVYILGSRNRVLYTGVTNDLGRRVAEHKSHLIPGFTKKYNVDRLLYYEELFDIKQAIVREKQIKDLLRSKKLALIAALNPDFNDLAEADKDSSLRNSSLRSELLHSE